MASEYFILYQLCHTIGQQIGRFSFFLHHSSHYARVRYIYLVLDKNMWSFTYSSTDHASISFVNNRLYQHKVLLHRGYFDQFLENPRSGVNKAFLSSHQQGYLLESGGIFEHE